MRRLAGIVGGAAGAALVLAGCGSTSLGSIKQLMSSIRTNSNVQAHITASFTGAGSAKAAAILKDVSLDVQVSGPGGSSISSSKSSDFAIAFNVNSTPALELRKVGQEIYVKADFTALGTIPSVPASTASQMSAAQAIFGGRWFELPPSLLTGLAGKSSTGQKAASSIGQAPSEASAVQGYLLMAHHTSASSGYKESGTLQSLASELYPTLHALDPSITSPSGVKGTYSFQVTGSGSNATSMVFSVTAPNGTLGNATGTLHVSLTHDGTTVSAPSGATVITPQLLAQLLGSSSGAGLNPGGLANP